MCTNVKLQLINALLQLGMDKAGLFLKPIDLEVRAIHFIRFKSTLFVTVQQKQTKPHSCTHAEAMEKIHKIN